MEENKTAKLLVALHAAAEERSGYGYSDVHNEIAYSLQQIIVTAFAMLERPDASYYGKCLDDAREILERGW
jgi:hypothetical protein